MARETSNAHNIIIENRIIERFFADRAKTKEDRVRLIVFLIGIFSGIIAYPLHFLGLWGSDNPVLLSMSAAIFVGLVIIFALFYFRKVTLFHAFASYGILMLVGQCAKILFITISTPPGAPYLILFNFFICMLVITLFVMGYMHIVPLYLTGISLLTSIVANIIRPGAVQTQFVLFFLFIELLSCALGIIAWRSVHDMEKENIDLHEEENDLLSAFNMSREELLAYIAMSKKKNQSASDVSRFFDNLDERTEHNIIKAVRQRETAVRMQNERVEECYPQLSPTEADVCRLVMHGKTLKEIARLTGKTANNVSAVRNHIRKKLGLQTGQDLREYLNQNAIIGA